jgi:O-antigen/teichoic acid export membrane protein
MIIVVALRETKLSVRPRYDAAYIRQAFRYGPKFMLSTLLMGVSARADLLVVHELLGDRETGFYSIALTLSAMAGMIPGALTNASFPHLANFEEREWIDTTIRVCRLGLATAILTSIGMVIAIPVVLPLLFGARYLPAIVPANILIVGAIFASAQWLICRSAAARGRMRPLFVSYAANFAVMLGLDVLLIPIYGNIGAAWASVIAPVLGLAVAIVEFNRGQTTKLSFNLVPRPADVVEVWKIVTRTVLRHSARDTRE